MGSWRPGRQGHIGWRPRFSSLFQRDATWMDSTRDCRHGFQICDESTACRQRRRHASQDMASWEDNKMATLGLLEPLTRQAQLTPEKYAVSTGGFLRFSDLHADVQPNHFHPPPSTHCCSPPPGACFSRFDVSTFPGRQCFVVPVAHVCYTSMATTSSAAL